MCSMKFFIQLFSVVKSGLPFGTEKPFHGLYSDFDVSVNHKTNSHLTVLLLSFVFCLRVAKYTFTGSGFVLDLIIPLHRGNLSFFS